MCICMYIRICMYVCIMWSFAGGRAGDAPVPQAGQLPLSYVYIHDMYL